MYYADEINEEALYQDLKALYETAFPKQCPQCGKIYISSSDFINQSFLNGKQSGLYSFIDENDEPVVELARNCECGSILVDYFSNRRQDSPSGKQRRELFSRLLRLLEDKGFQDIAREELLKVMHGEKSILLENFGINYHSE